MVSQVEDDKPASVEENKEVVDRDDEVHQVPTEVETPKEEPKVDTPEKSEETVKEEP